MPKLSIIMSVYSEPIEWMRLSVDSILNQSYKDFEFIIINDKPDRKENRELLDVYKHKDNRIVLINNKVNLGLTKSLNIGLLAAKGEYIARMDADDISLPDRLKQQVDFLDTHPEVSIVGCSAYKIDEEGNVIDKLIKPTNNLTLKSQLIIVSPFIHPSVVFRRQLNRDIVLYDEYYRFAQDYALWVKLSDYEFANMDGIYMKYRITKCQITSAKRGEQLTYSHSIQKEALKRLGINLKDEDIDMLFLISDNQILDYYKAYRFILIFCEDNKNNKKIDVQLLKNYMSSLLRNSIAKGRSPIKNYIKYIIPLNGFTIKDFISFTHLIIHSYAHSHLFI